MKLRIAKKIIKRRSETISYVSRTRLDGRERYLLLKSYAVVDRWVRRVSARYKGRYATFEISNGTETVKGTAKIVKCDKKYVWLSNNSDFSGIRFPWSDIIKVE